MNSSCKSLNIRAACVTIAPAHLKVISKSWSCWYFSLKIEEDFNSQNDKCNWLHLLLSHTCAWFRALQGQMGPEELRLQVCVCVCGGGGVLKLGRKTTIGKANKHCLCLTNLSNAVELCWILSQFLYILCATGKHLDLESVVNIDVWSELEMIVCQFCNSRFHSQKSFILHSKKHEHEKQFILKCDFCPRQYNSVCQFQRHCYWHELKRKRDRSASNEAESSPSPDAWQIARGAPRGGGSYDEQNLRQYNTIHPLAWWRAGGENKRRRARPLPAHVACHSSRGRHARNQAAPRGARAWRRSHRARSASPAVVLHIPVLF